MNTDGGVQSYKLIAVHAGLENGKDVKEQLKTLKARDTRVPKVRALSGRQTVWDIPKVIACCFFCQRDIYISILLQHLMF